MKTIFALLFLMNFSSAKAANCNTNPPVNTTPGLEFPIYDGCGFLLTQQFQMTATEGYKIGTIDKVMRNPESIFRNYIPTPSDTSLWYEKPTFDPKTNILRIKIHKYAYFNVFGKKVGKWFVEEGSGIISIAAKTCATGVKGYAFDFHPDPKFIPKIDDAFRKAGLTVCYTETADGLLMNSTGTMVGGAGFASWVSHVTYGIILPMIGQVHAQIKVQSH